MTTTWRYRAYTKEGQLIGELCGDWTLQNNTISAFDAFEHHYGTCPSKIERVKGSKANRYLLVYPGSEK